VGIQDGLKAGERVIVEGQTSNRDARANQGIQGRRSSAVTSDGKESEHVQFLHSRPIVAIVIAILTVIIGVIMAVGLPVAQFPNIAHPDHAPSQLSGADAKTLETASRADRAAD